MTERPILFSGEMVRAILDGRKTQTRRVMKPRGPHERVTFEAMQRAVDIGLRCEFRFDKSLFVWHWEGERSNGASVYVLRCPYGQPGDRLWVRETFAPVEIDGTAYLYRADADPSNGGRVPYQVSGAGGTGSGVGAALVDRWRPSIHMPRRASRLTLEITNVCVERLRDVSDEDGIAEGYSSGGAFINGAFSLKYWHANPWLWVIDFRRAPHDGAPA